MRVATCAAGGATLSVVLAACGGGSSPTSVASTTGSNSANNASFSSVSGKVIAASASSAAVQETSGPQTIDFSSSTRFTATASTTRSSLAKGDCVTVASTATGAGTSSRPTPGATPSVPRNVTARSVTVTSTSGCPQATGGQGGFGGFPRGNFTPPAGGFGEGGTPRPFPTASGFPGGRFGSGGSGGFRTGFGGAFGTIAAISGSSFTVKSSFGSSTTITVKTTSSTTYDATSTTSASAVQKGQCVNAIGSDDVSGVLDARSVSISSPVNGTCPAPTTSFGGFGGGFGGRGFGGSGSGAPGGNSGV
jgi:hypothetical protein